MIDPRLEAEYNNRRKVPEHPEIMAGWQRDAAAFRAATPFVELGVTYGPSERQRLDLFEPRDEPGAPLAMFIHGGYWQSLDRSWFSHLARGFLENGIALAIPSYDLCPDVTLSTLVDEIRQAAAFLIRRSGRDLYATGHSAGGHLTAMLLATDWAAMGVSEGIVSGGCAISGLFDLERLIGTSINGALGLDAAEARRLSPLHAPQPRGHLRAAVGALEGEEYARQSAAITAAWNGTLQVLPGANHFTAVDALTDPRSRLMQAIVTGMAAGRS